METNENPLMQKGYLLKVRYGLDLDDCFYLINEKSYDEQKIKKIGYYYCSIKNNLVYKKYCSKIYCEYFYSINSRMVDNI